MKVLAALLTITILMDAAIAAQPSLTQPLPIEQLVQQGNDALENFQREQAEAIWREVIRRDPRNAIAYVKLGDSLRYRQRDQEAIEAYAKAIELAPKRVDGYLALADLLRFDQEDAAIRVYRRAIAVAEPDAEVYYMLGITLVADRYGNRVIPEERYDEAIAAFRGAIAVNPQDGGSYVALGEQLERRGQLQAAIAAYQAGMRLNDLQAYWRYDHILTQQGRLGEMVAIYQQAIQRNSKAPNVFVFYRALGHTLDKLRRLDEAEMAYRQVIQLNPDDLYTYFTLGDLLQKQGKSAQAVSFYQRAAEVVRPDSLASPGDAFSYAQVGDELKTRGLFDLAIATYGKAFELNPQDDRPHAWIGDVLRLQGKLDEAAQSFRRSIALNPDFAYAYRGLGKVLQQQGKLQEAVEAYRQALSINPDYREVQDTLPEVEALLRAQQLR